MSLHYLAKLEMLSGACYQVLEKKTPEFIPSHLWPPNSPDLNPVDHSMWELLQEKVYKIGITDLNKLKQRLRTEWANWIMSLLWQPFVSGVVDSSRTVILFLTPLVAIFPTRCYQLDSNLAYLEATAEVG